MKNEKTAKRNQGVQKETKVEEWTNLHQKE